MMPSTPRSSRSPSGRGRSLSRRAPGVRARARAAGTARRDRDLVQLQRTCAEAARRPAQPYRGDAGRRGGHADRPAAVPAGSPAAAGRERADADPVPGRGPAQHARPAAAIARASLTSMLNRTSGHAPSRSSSSGIGSVPPIRAAATSRCGSCGDPPWPPGDPVQASCRGTRQHPVGGRPDVRLQVGVAEADGVLEGAPGVLRAVRRPAAVREGQRAREVKEVTRSHRCQYAHGAHLARHRTAPTRRAGQPRRPLPAACLGQRDRRGGGHVQRAHPAGLRYVGDHVGGGQQRGGAAAVLVAEGQADIPGQRRLVQRDRAVGQLDGDDPQAVGRGRRRARRRGRLALAADQAARCRARSCGRTDARAMRCRRRARSARRRARRRSG